jgi:hypothetical protein
MHEADTETTIRNPDAALLKLIAKHDDVSSEALRLDEESIIAGRRGEAARSAELSARSDKFFNRGEALFWELVFRKPATAEGHAAKVKMIAASSFDAEDLIAVAWRLGWEAGKLGLSSTMPRLMPLPVAPMAAAGWIDVSTAPAERPAPPKGRAFCFVGRIRTNRSPSDRQLGACRGQLPLFTEV